MAERNAKGHFLPGASGNPAGRPVGSIDNRSLEVRVIADPYALVAFEKILQLMFSSEDETLQFRAAQEILNRRFGRPPQSVYVGGAMAPKNEDALPRPDTFEEWLQYQQVVQTADGVHVISRNAPNGKGNGNGHAAATDIATDEDEQSD